MGMRTLNRKTLLMLPLFGHDVEDDEDKKKITGDDKGVEKTGSKKTEEDDEDEDDLSGIEDPKDRRIAELSRESAKRRREKNALKREYEELLSERDTLKNSGATETEQLKAQLQTEKDRNDKLAGSVSKNLLRTAIVENDKYAWHDVSVVIGQLDMVELEIDVDDLVVDGLDAQLKKLAKDKPFLLKKKVSDEDGQQQQNSGSTGNNPRGGRTTDQAVTQREELLRRYKSLQPK